MVERARVGVRFGGVAQGGCGRRSRWPRGLKGEAGKSPGGRRRGVSGGEGWNESGKASWESRCVTRSKVEWREETPAETRPGSRGAWPASTSTRSTVRGSTPASPFRAHRGPAREHEEKGVRGVEESRERDRLA
ncbi:hypothetical protein M427DRAFT_420376 [Gonapodya prolifera JEL478]|uniref:Uncharacterized protein n=1 Tax=Gonapodya prolifera (strain JEL478) TaxID=1344416 RepID=A0A139A5B9_GONPJ|nr:hypothetical protein M427DRAFT_420376 [Gonapodya prolifera JEL478]|eukprot:KXS11829.1 hypothetical protein M427DRAFT_420376 [Gonapodya prolifera JEL478]